MNARVSALKEISSPSSSTSSDIDNDNDCEICNEFVHIKDPLVNCDENGWSLNWSQIKKQKWYLITPCIEDCTICSHVEALSYKEHKFDSNFPGLRVKCIKCGYYITYEYCKKGVTIRSSNLEFIHVKARQLDFRVCCILKPPFLYRQTERRCKQCTIKALNPPDDI
jgi:hypothetical protein